MKKLLLFLLFCSVMHGIQGQSASQLGKISLNPYVDETDCAIPQTRELLITKLNQIATVNGCAGEGFDNRFVIAAHLQALDETTTSSVPAKVAVRLSVTLYVGDGLDGTLFSSANVEVKGIGNSKDDAWKSAIRKINAKDPILVKVIDEGKVKIVKYYDQAAPSILSKAKASAQGGDYESAICQLMAIPATCAKYNEAQALIGKYGQTASDKSNLKIINDARAAWSASPNESGAASAKTILSGISNPSSSVLQQAQSLEKEIASRLKAVSDREFNLQVQRETDATKVQIASINAAAKIASAYYKSRPRVVYHVHWW